MKTARTAGKVARGEFAVESAVGTVRGAGKILVQEETLAGRRITVLPKTMVSEQQAITLRELLQKTAVSIGNLNALESRLSEWLGSGTRFIRNEAGDPVFLSKDGLRCVRFDFNHTYPHTNPHAHAEVKIDGKWVKSGPIYPTDIPHQ